jgi:methyltransferase (TIGR00027 family)
MDTLGMTSRLVAAARARESMRPDRLFDDPFAAALAGADGRAMLAASETAPRQAYPGRQTPLENPYLSIRTWFLDRVALDAARDGIRQIVIMASGMDARAFRLDWPAGTTVFELERAEVLDYKESVLASINAVPRATRIAIAIDLRDGFRTALAKAEFSESKRALFLVEGLMPYLPDESTAFTLLSRISECAAPGSALAMDMIGRSFLESPWTRPYLEMLERHGVPWRFGTDDPETLLERCGFTDLQVQQPGEVAPSGRWPFPQTPRSVPDFPRTFLVTAKRAAH